MKSLSRSVAMSWHYVPVLILLTITACEEGTSRMQQGSADGPAASPVPSMDASGGMGVDKFREIPNKTLPPATQAAPLAPSMIIRNGNVSVEVDSLEVAMAAVRGLAGKLGGYVGNVSVHTGEFQVRSSTLQLKIPSARFDEAMSGMAAFGKVESSTATAEDVGEEFVDVQARMANGKRLEERLISLLATRAGSLEDVLAVERELARVRQEIERLEGRIRYLGTRVATSTIDVTVHEKAPLIGSQPGTNIIARAFVNAWRNFVTFIALCIESLGILLPLAVLGVLIYIVGQRWKKRLNNVQ